MLSVFKSFKTLKHSIKVFKRPIMDLFKHPEQSRIIWIDLEMTGLDIEKCHIIEAACIITDANLNIIAEGPDIIINQPDEILDTMQPWCIKVHGKSGLTEACRQSNVNLQAAEMQLLSFVRQHTPKGKCPLAGNSIHMDRVFLEKYMPELVEHLNYRIVDVSSVKELCKRWYPTEFQRAVKLKTASHRALADIRESIDELKFYRETIFK